MNKNENNEKEEIKKNKENEEYIPLQSDGINGTQSYQKNQIKNLKIVIVFI